MTSIFIAAITAIALLALALSVLTVLALRAERRDQDARARRYRTSAAQPVAVMYALADRRKAPAQAVELDRRAA
jgi:hypothetical protein